MSLALRLTLLLAASPAAMFLGHVAAYRGLRAGGRRPTAHTSAIAGIGLSFVALVVATAAMAWADVTSSLLVAAATLIDHVESAFDMEVVSDGSLGFGASTRWDGVVATSFEVITDGR